MTTVNDLGVTEGKIRSFVIAGKSDALTKEQLIGICYDYLNKVIRKQERKWPKDLRFEMTQLGISQNIKTGLPQIHPHAIKLKEKVSDAEESFRLLLDNMKDLVEANDIITLVDSIPLPEPKISELQVQNDEIIHLNDKIEFQDSVKISLEGYMTRLRKFITENDLTPPEMIGSDEYIKQNSAENVRHSHRLRSSGEDKGDAT